jgi:hypothetical protein
MRKFVLISIKPNYVLSPSGAEACRANVRSVIDDEPLHPVHGVTGALKMRGYGLAQRRLIAAIDLPIPIAAPPSI